MKAVWALALFTFYSGQRSMFLAFRLYIGSGFFKVGLFFPRIHFYGHSIVHFTVTMVKVKTELVRAGVLAFFISIRK